MGESMRAMGWARAFPVGDGVREGRRWAREHLDRLGWTVQAPETVDAVLLTVSELITNAHVHAHATAQLVLTWDGRCLHVGVSDSSTGLPSPRAPNNDSFSGRGLVLVDAVADGWQIHLRPDGKTVTACFYLPDQPDPHGPGATDPPAPPPSAPPQQALG